MQNKLNNKEHVCAPTLPQHSRSRILISVSLLHFHHVFQGPLNSFKRSQRPFAIFTHNGDTDILSALLPFSGSSGFGRSILNKMTEHFSPFTFQPHMPTSGSLSVALNKVTLGCH